MEIERKYKIKALPDNLDTYECRTLVQAYLNTNPVIRIRKEDSDYYLTYKGKGLLSREEYNLPLNEASFQHLLKKADGTIISKKRYLIPLSNPTFSNGYPGLPKGETLTIELDIFDPPFSPLIIAEVEFPDEKTANAFLAPDWFLEDVTFDSSYHNSTLSRMVFEDTQTLP